MSATASPENLLRHGLTRVLSDAQSGELPLFVWTQGLPQDELLAVVRFCLPRLGAVQPMPAAEYRHLQQQVPPDVAVLASLLQPQQPTHAPQVAAGWLAQMLACLSCCDSRDWWQGLGLRQPADEMRLLQHYLPDFAPQQVAQGRGRQALVQAWVMAGGHHALARRA